MDRRAKERGLQLTEEIERLNRERDDRTFSYIRGERRER